MYTHLGPVLLPLAFECPTLMNALAASASTHLALRDQRFHSVSLRHRGLALAELESSIRDGDMSQEMCLAVTMVLCCMESISDGTNSWFCHLAGAAALLGGQQAEGHVDGKLPVARMKHLQTFEGRWLLRNFAYHDVLMSVSMDCRPFLLGDYWMSEDDALADPYFGLASRILLFISETSVLNADFAEAEAEARTRNGTAQDTPGHDTNTDTGTNTGTGSLLDDSGPNGQQKSPRNTGAFSQRARTLEGQIRGWVCPPGTDGKAPLALLAEAYRAAALIHLYRTLRRHVTGYSGVLHDKTQACVASLCEISKSIPHGSLAECTLLFPVFIAGGEAVETSHIEILRERLVALNQWRKFRNVEACLDVLDQVWRLRAAGSQSSGHDTVDWLDIVKHRNWKLSLS